MAPGGGVFFSRDREGIVRRHRRLGINQAVEVNESTVEWAVNRYGYDRVDKDLPDWSSLEAFVIASIPTREVSVADLPVNPMIARQSTGVLRKWLNSRSDVHLVVPVVNRLIANALVRADEQLCIELLEISTAAAFSLRAAPSELRLLDSTPDSGLGRPRRSQSTLNFYVDRAA